MSIEAMKQALEALDAYSWEQVDAARAALRTAIEQAEKQEPVAHQGWCASLTQMLLSNPPQPAACNCNQPAAQREWVGLTKEEIKEISFANRPYVVDMVVALEAKLKEKNG